MTDVVVLADELRNNSGILRLIKFHGCAVKAAQDPGKYPDALIGRASQISAWSEANETAAIRGELISLATTRPTLMIGLSAQDENIQTLLRRESSDGLALAQRSASERLRLRPSWSGSSQASEDRL